VHSVPSVLAPGAIGVNFSPFRKTAEDIPLAAGLMIAVFFDAALGLAFLPGVIRPLKRYVLRRVTGALFAAKKGDFFQDSPFANSAVFSQS
jgi:hypothetical protein